MSLKAAILHITTVELTCPYCHESLTSFSGSHMFPLDEPHASVLNCGTCKREVKWPARAEKLKEREYH